VSDNPQNSIPKIKSKSHWREIAASTAIPQTEELKVVTLADKESKFDWNRLTFGVVAVTALFVLLSVRPSTNSTKPKEEAGTGVGTDGGFSPIAGTPDEGERPSLQQWIQDPDQKKQSDALFLIEFLDKYPAEFIEIGREIDLKLELKNIRDKLTEHLVEPK
jgi:hypothetical protein